MFIYQAIRDYQEPVIYIYVNINLICIISKGICRPEWVSTDFHETNRSAPLQSELDLICII